MSTLSFIWPLTGGLLIGASAGLFLLMHGRIAGISGLMASGLRLGGSGPRDLSLGFLGGLLGGALLAGALIRRPEVIVTSSLPLLIIGGLLVGFGTRWGSGCTSGHGVCGIARLSPRSLAATALFMGTAAVTVFVTRHLIGGM
ncbi:YeeE/YedE family protein [Brevundimonas poindexterae]|uniref:YeeE/YedE family protein n=1 Tax=Brevundimonas poindexterae TaxID=74325 RepID=UPI001CFC7C43|nr:YeeE/YedE thiosulfate transporter family protein [Brevundimonas poindexterae]